MACPMVWPTACLVIWLIWFRPRCDYRDPWLPRSNCCPTTISSSSQSDLWPTDQFFISFPGVSHNFSMGVARYPRPKVVRCIFLFLRLLPIRSLFTNTTMDRTFTESTTYHTIIDMRRRPRVSLSAFIPYIPLIPTFRALPRMNQG